MSDNNISERFYPILAALLNLPQSNLSAASSMATVEAWDSLKQMHLVLALEEEFGIEFSDEEISSVASAAGLIESIEGKLAASGA